MADGAIVIEKLTRSYLQHKEESAKMKSAGTETVGFASCTVGNVTDVEVNIDSKTPYSSGSKRASEGSSKDGSSSKKRKYVLNMVYKERVVDHRCAVCMDSFDSTDLLCLLPCEHYFHVPCTEGWMKVTLAS